MLYDRTSGDDANGGTLTFSDGSTVDVSGIPGNGDAKTVTFAMRTFDSVRFQVNGGTGPNVGLLEFEVYARPRGGWPGDPLPPGGASAGRRRAAVASAGRRRAAVADRDGC